MDFSLICVHEDSCKMSWCFLKHAKIMVLPEWVMYQTGVQSCAEFQEKIQHGRLQFMSSSDVTTVMAGSMSLGTSRLHFVSNWFRDTFSLLRVSTTKITKITSEEEAEGDMFVDEVECHIRLSSKTWRFFQKEGEAYVAVQHRQFKKLSPQCKSQLRGMGCKLAYNVSYSDEAGTASHRSILVPQSLMCVSPIRKGEAHAILVQEDNGEMRVVHTSGNVEMKLIDKALEEAGKGKRLQEATFRVTDEHDAAVYRIKFHSVVVIHKFREEASSAFRKGQEEASTST